MPKILRLECDICKTLSTTFTGQVSSACPDWKTVAAQSYMYAAFQHCTKEIWLCPDCSKRLGLPENMKEFVSPEETLIEIIQEIVRNTEV